MVVLRNLDSVVRTMLHRPHLMEARTPQGCLEPHSGLTWFNTGVWAVRPNVSAFDDLLRWLHRGSSVCYDGDQSAAMGFWRIPGGSGRRERREVLTLHVGFNIKADQGPETCMRKRNINQSDLPSCTSQASKAFVAQPRKDPTWRLARQSYLSVFGRWESTGSAGLHGPTAELQRRLRCLVVPWSMARLLGPDVRYRIALRRVSMGVEFTGLG